MSDIKKPEQESLSNANKKGASRRRNRKKQQKISRWSGLILLLSIMIIGLMLWVSGEVREGLSEESSDSTKIIEDPVLEPASRGVIIIE